MPDNSKILLLKRKILNTYLVKKDCNSNASSTDIRINRERLRLNIFEKGEFLKSSNLLIDLIGENFRSFSNISLANDSFHNTFQENSCYFLTQEVPINLSGKNLKNLTIK